MRNAPITGVFVAADGTQHGTSARAARPREALPGDCQRFLAAGLDDHVAKPVQLEDLRAVARSAS